MKLACNIRWRLRLELQQLHGPRKQMSNWMSEYCFAFEGSEIMWGEGSVLWSCGKTTTGSRPAFVCKPKCMSMKNIFGVRYANMNQKWIYYTEGGKSEVRIFPNIMSRCLFFFLSYEFVGSVPVALLAIFMHLSWLLRAFNFAQKTIQFVSKLCRQEMEKWLAFLNGNRNDKVH